MPVERRKGRDDTEERIRREEGPEAEHDEEDAGGQGDGARGPAVSPGPASRRRRTLHRESLPFTAGHPHRCAARPEAEARSPGAFETPGTPWSRRGSRGRG